VAKRLASVLAPIVLLAGCGGGSSGAPAYPLDDTLRIDQIQAKGTHNSYHHEPAQPLPSLIPDWAYSMPTLTDQLELYGVRQIELDVHFQLAQQRLAVYHLPLLDPFTVCFWFSDCLSEIKAWSDAHPEHHPMMILIEPKDDIDLVKLDTHMQELDREIREVWPEERIITPDRLRGGAATLGEALAAHGWPTLGESRGQVLFALDDHSQLRDEYVAGDPTLTGRAIFALFDPTDPNAAVLDIDNAAGAEDQIRAAVAAHLLVRSIGDGASSVGSGDTSERDAALAAGSHFISTDFPASAGPGTYSFDIPGGTPSRCNPVSAPPECTPEAIENLR